MSSTVSNRLAAGPSENDNGNMHLELDVCDPVVVGFLAPYEGSARIVKALEALRVGAGVLQMASPTIDVHIVKDEFAELEARLQKDLAEALGRYFKEGEGVLPRSLNGLFGESGVLAGVLQSYFDQDGRVARLIQSQIGSGSKFGQALDPNNKKGVIALIEDRITKLVEDKVLKQFSLDEDGSAFSRLKAMIADGLTGLNQALGIKAAQAAEAERGHVKGFEFEADLYRPLAAWGRQIGDETQLVRGSPGAVKQKWGDYVVIMGETSGAPGARIAVEVKDQRYKAKAAIEEMDKAKKNREAVSGIFVSAKGCEPVEFGDFRLIGNDFFCTVDRESMEQEQSLIFFWAAYQIARAQVVVAVRKDANGKLDLECVQQQIDGLRPMVDRLGEIVTKAGTIQRSGQAIESAASTMKEDLQRRIRDVFNLLRLSSDE